MSPISVVIPTRDRVSFLRRALETVLAQTWREVEIIVVDDGSAQPLAPPMLGVAAPRVRLLRHEQPRGAAAARNTGLRCATGDLVAFLDDDDTWLPDKLARQAAVLSAAPPRVGAVYCAYHRVSERTDSVFATMLLHSRPIGFVELLRSTSFGASIPLIRRQCFDEVGMFDESLPGTHDQDMWLRIAQKFDFAPVSEVLARMHFHGDQITGRLPVKLLAKERVLQKWEDELARHPAILAHHLTRLAMLCFAAGEAAKARVHLRRAQTCCGQRRSAAAHIVLSQIVPRLHRSWVTRTAFRRVDGFNLYY